MLSQLGMMVFESIIWDRDHNYSNNWILYLEILEILLTTKDTKGTKIK
jgi:hypothetical protein